MAAIGRGAPGGNRPSMALPSRPPWTCTPLATNTERTPASAAPAMSVPMPSPMASSFALSALPGFSFSSVANVSA